MEKPANDVLDGLPKPVGNPEVIRVLETALSSARAGEVHGVALVMAQGPENVNIASAGGFAGSMVMGLEQLKRMLLDNLFSQKRSPILRPGRMM